MCFIKIKVSRTIFALDKGALGELYLCPSNWLYLLRSWLQSCHIYLEKIL